MSDVFIYSTMTCSVIFNIYTVESDKNAIPKVLKSIEIYGGHGMRLPKGIDTVRGVVTRVSARDYEMLQKEIGFVQQVKAGFLLVDSSQVDPEKKLKDMAEKDKSAPLTPEDFEKSELNTKNKPAYKAVRTKKG